VHDSSEPSQRGGAVGGHVPTVLVERSQRVRVGDDDDVPGGAGEDATLRVDDRPARTDQVDRAEGLLVRERRVRRSVQDLDRPRAQDEQAERDPDEQSEPAEADVEAGAAEVRRVGARIRLQPSAAGKAARERDPARRLGAGDAYGTCRLARKRFLHRHREQAGLASLLGRVELAFRGPAGFFALPERHIHHSACLAVDEHVPAHVPVHRPDEPHGVVLGPDQFVELVRLDVE
jgi:hypothetical protein